MNPPKILKGAFVQFDPSSPNGRIITFQINPEKLSRTITLQDDNSRRETIAFSLIADAADNLERGDPTTVEYGVYPLLSALEFLVGAVPRTNPTNRSGSLRGAEVPFTLFVWGKRSVPVRVVELHVEEPLFDPNLNPLRAEVQVLLEVLSEREIKGNRKALEFLNTYLTMRRKVAEFVSPLM